MNAITSSGRKVDHPSHDVPPFVARVPALDKGLLKSQKARAAMIRWQWAQAGHDVETGVRDDGEIWSATINGLPVRRSK